jgi:pimeloyl-ACP methyl ester carboxylesterase
MGGVVEMQVAIRHPEKARKVVSISAVFRHDGRVKEALDMFPQLTADSFKGSPIEAEKVSYLLPETSLADPPSVQSTDARGSSSRGPRGS